MIPLMMQQDYAPKGWRKSHIDMLCLCNPVDMLLTWKHFARSGPDHGDEAVVCDVGCGEGR